jgi:hypothetical protein
MPLPGEKLVSLSVMIVIVFAAFYILLFIVIPSLGGSLTKPSLGAGEPVEPEHIDWLVKELGAGKLQVPAGVSGTPEIEFVVNPGGNYFTVTIEGGVPKTRSGPADDPDIRLSGSRDVIARLLAAENLFAEVKTLNQEGLIQLEMLRDREELAGRGYESLYDELTG